MIALDDESDTLFWNSYHALDYALVGFRASLPTVSSVVTRPKLERNGSSSSIPLSPTSPVSPISSLGLGLFGFHGTEAILYDVEECAHTILFAHVASLMAVMNVHTIFATKDESERGIVIRAAHDVARLVEEASRYQILGEKGGLDPRKTHMLIGVSIINPSLQCLILTDCYLLLQLSWWLGGYCDSCSSFTARERSTSCLHKWWNGKRRIDHDANDG